MARCEHYEFLADVTVNRLEDVGRFCADVRVKCLECGQPFRFLGLPVGLDLNGARVSVDGAEARLSISPADKEPLPLGDKAAGFSIKRCPL